MRVWGKSILYSEIFFFWTTTLLGTSGLQSFILVASRAEEFLGKFEATFIPRPFLQWHMERSPKMRVWRPLSRCLKPELCSCVVATNWAPGQCLDIWVVSQVATEHHHRMCLHLVDVSSLGLSQMFNTVKRNSKEGCPNIWQPPTQQRRCRLTGELRDIVTPMSPKF